MSKKGPRFERELADRLVNLGFPEADRAVQKGALDEGDITGVPELTIEAKNRKQMDLAGALDEAMEEKDNAGTRWGAAVVKRPGKNADHAYWVEPVWQAAERHRLLLDGQQFRAVFEAARRFLDAPSSRYRAEKAALRRAVSAAEDGSD